jgi:hypothetical protein
VIPIAIHDGIVEAAVILPVAAPLADGRTEVPLTDAEVAAQRWQDGNGQDNQTERR